MKPSFLIDVNLPYKFKSWDNEKFIHVRDINDEWSDSQIWLYAKENKLTIVTKDVDFSNRIILSTPSPRVIHVKVGNMRLSDFRQFMMANWENIEQMSSNHKLVDVYPDRMTGID